MTRCYKCRRELTNPLSVKLGIGPVCRRRLGVPGVGPQNADDLCDTYLPIPLESGIVLRRDVFDELSVSTNVPHLVVEHSPTGYEFGFGGSGPADLSLNLVELLLTRRGYQGERQECFDGSCYSLSYRLHQRFKARFIAPAPREGTVIPLRLVEKWLDESMAADPGS